MGRKKAVSISVKWINSIKTVNTYVVNKMLVMTSATFDTKENVQVSNLKHQVQITGWIWIH